MKYKLMSLKDKIVQMYPFIEKIKGQNISSFIHQFLLRSKK